VGEVFRDAVRRQAAAIVVAHNHPSGDPTPSTDDLRITADLVAAGRLLDVELLDHVVVGAGSWVSIRSLGAWT
jgi:DNA repair protein RadC